MGQAEEIPDERRVRGQRRLRDGAKPQALRGEQEGLHVHRAVDRTVDAKLSLGGDARGMRRAEQPAAPARSARPVRGC
jgi:hypothetical protein